jgi:hypothetical protein
MIIPDDKFDYYYERIADGWQERRGDAYTAKKFLDIELRSPAISLTEHGTAIVMK